MKKKRVFFSVASRIVTGEVSSDGVLKGFPRGLHGGQPGSVDWFRQRRAPCRHSPSSSRVPVLVLVRTLRARVVRPAVIVGAEVDGLAAASAA